MVDYTKPTGNAGTLIIRDSGSTVEFWLSCTEDDTNGSVPWSGTVNGVPVSGTFAWAFGGGTRRIAGPWNVSTAQQVTFSIGGTGTWGFEGPTSLTAQITRALPGAPTGLAVTRNSDTSHALGWSRQAVYTSVVIQRTTGDGTTWTGWQQVGIAPGNAFSFTDTTTVANRRYVYRVAGRTAAGQSVWSNQAQIDTTPSVPTGVSAVRNGSNIVVDATGKAAYATSFDVRDGETVVASAVSLPYTHVAPNPAAPHTYTVRARIGTLASAYSAPSNTVQLIAPPLAPSNLAPNGSVVESGARALTWQHNPADSSPQSAFELRHRAQSSDAWVTVAGTTASSYTLTVPAGSRQWEVRTKGQHPDWSPWSATAVFTGASTPGVAVTQPDGVWNTSALTVGWSWFQAEGRPQSAWEYELFEGGVLVERRTGSGSATSAVAGQRVRPGAWLLRIRAATGDLWSGWAEEPFEVVFEAPGVPLIGGLWDDENGSTVLTVAPGPQYTDSGHRLYVSATEPPERYQNLWSDPLPLSINGSSLPVGYTRWFPQGGTAAAVTFADGWVSMTAGGSDPTAIRGSDWSNKGKAVLPNTVYTLSVDMEKSAGLGDLILRWWAYKADNTGVGGMRQTTGVRVGGRVYYTFTTPAETAFITPGLGRNPNSAWVAGDLYRVRNTRLNEGTDATFKTRFEVGDEWHVLVGNAISEVRTWNGNSWATTATAPIPDTRTVSIAIDRSTDNGETWDAIGSVPGEATLIDWESPSYGDTIYRATALTVEGASAEASITVEARSEAIWLSGGAGYGTTARLPMNPNVAHTSGRQRALKQWAGRSLPVAVTGEAIGRTVSVSGDITDRDYGTATVEDMRGLSQLGTDVFLFRDPDGRRIYGQIGEIQMERKMAISTEADGWNGLWGYGFTLTEVSK